MADPFELADINDDEIESADYDEAFDEPESEGRESRQERRAARGRERESERKRLEERLEEVRQENARMQGQLEAMQRGTQQQAPDHRVAAMQQADNMLSEAVRRRDRAGQRLVQLEQQKADAEAIREAEREFHEAETARDEAAFTKFLVKRAPPPPSAEQQEIARAREGFVRDYADIANNFEAGERFRAELRIKSKGDSSYRPSKADLDEAAETVRKQLKLRDPGDRGRAAMEGYGPGHQGSGGAPTRALTAVERQMAKELYKYESDQRKREQMFRREVLSQD